MILPLLLSTFLMRSAASPPDTLHQHMVGEAAVVGRRPPVVASRNGALLWKVRAMGEMPHILGTADPLRMAQLLPGVSTNNDFAAGLHIQGCEAGHTRLSLDNAPIYNAQHLLGLFSTFTPSHFSTMRLTTNGHAASSDAGLGGVVSFEPLDSLSRQVHLDATLSVMHSEGTLTLPLGRRATLRLSGRGSYLNLFYKELLDGNDFSLRYGLNDLTATLSYQPAEGQHLRLTLYDGADHTRFLEYGTQGKGNVRWGNRAASAVYEQALNDHSRLTHAAHASQYVSRFNLALPAVGVDQKSSITECGLSETLHSRFANATQLEAGASYRYYNTRPLQFSSTSASSTMHSPSYRETAHEANAFVSATHRFATATTLEAGLRLSLLKGSTTYFTPCPRLSVRQALGSHGGTLTLSYGRYVQHLRRVALSTGALPVDYRLTPQPGLPPERAHNLSLRYELASPSRSWHYAAEIYYKRLAHQTEFHSSIFDLVAAPYDMNATLLHGSGRNYGLGLMVRRGVGRLTGWVSYALSRAERRFPALGGTRWFRAASDRRHDLALVASYRLSPRFTLAGNFVYASGTAYTPVEHIFLINTFPVANYGAHNSASLPAHHRLDLSLDVRLGRLTPAAPSVRQPEHRLNFSVVNAYAHHNTLFTYLATNKSGVSIATVNTVFNLLPSVGYTVRF